ncbi:MAG TPA: S8 family serine peptidase, partial [Gemmatales bacterium]|nr:S8 family serine peptidase [Gemmatales bacterium]
MNSKAGPKLMKLLERQPSKQTRVSVNIAMTLHPASLLHRADINPKRTQEQQRITILRASEQIKQSQIEFLARISDRIQGKVRHIWINNVINLELPINTILELLQHDDLKLIELDQKLPTSAFLDQPDRLQSLSRKTPKGKDPSSFRTSSRSHHNLDSIGAPELWRMGLTGKGILLAVLDTGIEKSHPDFAGHLWDGGSTCPEHGWDTVIDSSSTVDIDGHGTYSAGIAAGIHTGVAPDATIMAVKVLHHASERGAAL